MLILGGSGIIGRATSQIALAEGFDVTVTGIEKEPNLDPRVKYVQTTEVRDVSGNWDCVFQVYTGFDQREVYTELGDCGNMFIMSTTMVYDQSNFTTQRLSEDWWYAAPGTQGGYVDKKIEVEKFWSFENEFWADNRYTKWRILRSSHILGPGSKLGCIPPHNRDPNLVETIKKGEIELCDGGSSIPPIF